jgi:UDP-N-acetylmuramoylalanine-D-glutamate ligase
VLILGIERSPVCDFRLFKIQAAHTLDVNAIIFSNLTGDHLDCHWDLQHYFWAKRNLLSAKTGMWSG